MGLALGSAMAATCLVAFSAAEAPRAVSLEERTVLSMPVDQVWSGIEEPIFWMRWDGLIGELSEGSPDPGSLRPTYDALLKLAGRTVPARLTLRETDTRYHMAWDVVWTEGSAVEQFRISITLVPRGEETEVTYGVTYHLPSFGARLANTLALEADVKEGIDQSLASLGRWTMEHSPL